ncbi:MAG: AraC family transcriptional regulator [Bacteroidetes bacterium]|nr:AraC family transcriptional regulator [Bacteroidota bacterium]
MTENQDKYTSLKIAVPTDYENVFSHFYYADNKSSDIISKIFLPSYQTMLIFNFGEKALLYSKNKTEVIIDRCFVLGPIKQAFDYSLPPNAQILVANFKDDAFYRFFGNASVAEHLPIHPDDLLDENCFTALWTALNKIEDINNRVHFILDFCQPYLRDRSIIAQRLANFNDENLNPVKSIASQLNQTERNIQLNHKKLLGYTSKEVNRYQRFLKAIELIQDIASTSTKIDWFEIINQCDYYDQSQLIHDFKHYLNISPTKYLKFQQDICVAKAE